MAEMFDRIAHVELGFAQLALLLAETRQVARTATSVSSPSKITFSFFWFSLWSWRATVART